MAYSVGDTVTLDGIESLIVYDAGSEQSWGRYLCVDKNHDIIYYFAGKDYTISDNSSSIAPTYKYGYEWGKYTVNIIPTNVIDQTIGAGLSNTNTLISLGLIAYSPDSYYCLWGKVKEFREQINSNEWFVPSYLELLEVYNHKNLLSNLVSPDDLNSYYWSSTESTESRAYRVNFISGGGGDTSKNGGDRRTRLCRYLSDPHKNIQISCSTSQSQIYYTDDNSDPNSSSNLYSSIFQTEDGNIIKAIATKEGWDDSNIAILDTSTSTISNEYIPEITRQSENNKTLTEDSNKTIL